MTDRNMTEILNEIGNIAISVATAGKPDRLLVIAEAERAMQSAGVWQDIGDQVVMHDTPRKLFRAVERLWEAAEADKKWAMLIFEVIDEQFTSEFLYPEDLDPAEEMWDRDERILAERFGNKEIVYGEWDVSDYTEVTQDDLEGRDD